MKRLLIIAVALACCVFFAGNALGHDDDEAWLIDDFEDNPAWYTLPGYGTWTNNHGHSSPELWYSSDHALIHNTGGDYSAYDDKVVISKRIDLRGSVDDLKLNYWLMREIPAAGDTDAVHIYFCDDTDCDWVTGYNGGTFGSWSRYYTNMAASRKVEKFRVMFRFTGGTDSTVGFGAAFDDVIIQSRTHSYSLGQLDAKSHPGPETMNGCAPDGLTPVKGPYPLPLICDRDDWVAKFQQYPGPFCGWALPGFVKTDTWLCPE